MFQVDIFWVVVGGADPSTVIDDLGDRVVSLHVKDGVTLPSAASAEPFVNVAVGEGVIDVAVRGRHRGPASGHRVAHRRVRPRRRAAGRGGPGQLRVPDGQRAGPRVASVTAARPARVGIVGCGNVTDLYLRGCATGFR